MSTVKCTGCGHFFDLDMISPFCPRCNTNNGNKEITPCNYVLPEHKDMGCNPLITFNAITFRQEEIDSLNKALKELGTAAITCSQELQYIAITGKRDSVEQMMLAREREREERSKQIWFAHKSGHQRSEKKSLDEKRAEVKEIMNSPATKKAHYTVKNFLIEHFHQLESIFIKYHPCVAEEKEQLISKYIKIKFSRLRDESLAWQQIERRFRAEYFKLLK